MYRILSIINIILVFIPAILLVRYLLLQLDNRSTLINILLLGLFLWSILDYSEAFYLSSFGDYAPEEFLEQGHSVGEILRYTSTGSIGLTVAYLLRRHLYRKASQVNQQNHELWIQWIKSKETKK